MSCHRDKPAHDLHASIRTRLAAGELPLADNLKIYGGYGSDQICDGCGLPIARANIVYEVQVSVNASRRVELAMHLECFETWVAESGKSRDSSQLFGPKFAP